MVSQNEVETPPGHDNMSSDAYTIHFLQGDKLVVKKTITWNMDEERFGVGCDQGCA